ncbi:MAG: IPT/TIG domain-containing protein, partial [Candidatus Marinimicrobia bacterium]|nr:IPT/TIG domain-containing protein [Candidatus Neomarinimicrobiota bacterium]
MIKRKNNLITLSLTISVLLGAQTCSKFSDLTEIPNQSNGNTPLIYSVDPANYSLTGTAHQVTISGENFVNDSLSNFVYFGPDSSGKSIAQLLSYSETELVVIPPVISGTDLKIRVDVAHAIAPATYSPFTLEKAVLPWGNIMEDDDFGVLTIDADESVYWLSRFDIGADTYEDNLYKISTLNGDTYTQELISKTLGYNASAASSISIYENKLYASIQMFVYVFDLEKTDPAKQLFMNLNFTALDDILLHKGYAYLIDGTSKKLYSIDTTGTLINGNLAAYIYTPVKTKIFDNKLYVATQKEIIEYSSVDPNILGVGTVLFTANTITDNIADFSFSADDELFLSLINNGIVKMNI